MIIVYHVVNTIPKASIASTAIIASLGSTGILHAITHPYITQLRCILSVDNSDVVNDDIKLTATTLNLFGNPKTAEFSLYQMHPVRVTQHPYANFQVDGKYYYVRIENVENELLREKLSARCNK